MSDEARGVFPGWSSPNLSILTLIAANLVPIIGVMFFGWDAGVILLVYWSENLVVGAYNILKMLLAQADLEMGCIKVVYNCVLRSSLWWFLCHTWCIRLHDGPGYGSSPRH